MWKYVSRRIRDSVERTYNVLEPRRTWTCGGEKNGNSNASTCNPDENTRPGTGVVPVERPTLLVVPFQRDNGWNHGSSSSSSSSDDDFRRQKNHCEFQQNVLGAITWSSAIVCGWYTSQILCMRRRHLRQDGWSMGQCKFSRTIMSPSQAFHSNLLSHWVLNAPAEQKRTSSEWIERTLSLNDGSNEAQKRASAVFPVNNVVQTKKSSEVDNLYLVVVIPT